MPAVSALVVNFNGGDVLHQAISALPSAGIPFESVLLMDNASTDGSAKEAARLFSGLTLLETGGEISFAEANNRGLKHLAAKAPPEAVLFLNNDALLDPGSVDRLAAVLERDPSLGAAAPIIYDGGGGLWYAGGTVDWKEAGGRLNGFGQPDSQEYHHPGRVTFATLCALLIRWSALEKTGLLDETYHFYDEDLDFCLRLGEAGYGIAYEPSASAVHMVGYSTALKGSSFVYFNMARNRLMTMRKYGTIGRWLLFLPYFSAMMSWKAVRFLLRGEGAIARAMASGIVRGITDKPVPVPYLAPRREEA